MAEVTRVTLVRKEIGENAKNNLRRMFGIPSLPLAETTFEIELANVPTAVASALRRAVTDEMQGYALQVPVNADAQAETTELYMLPPFVNQRITYIRLRSQIPPDIVDQLELELDVSNAEGGVPLSVYAGDMRIAKGSMPEPLFNPTTKIAVLQPGKRLVVRGIRISRGYGRDAAQYCVASCVINRPLDIEEYSDAEMREEKGIAADWSGYKVSSLVANPRRHLVRGILPATAAVEAESRTVLVDACANIVSRLRKILSAISGGEPHGIRLTVAQLEGGVTQATLLIPGETATIGELLTRTTFELASVSNVTHTGSLVITLSCADDAAQLIRKAIGHSISTFEKIQRGIEA